MKTEFYECFNRSNKAVAFLKHRTSFFYCKFSSDPLSTYGTFYCKPIQDDDAKRMEQCVCMHFKN